MIPFNKPYCSGIEQTHISDAIANGKLSGDGPFTKKCQSFFENRYGFKKTLLTTSCTDALELAAILLDIQAGDEVIIPSYTFVSTANAFVLRGAKIVFADSMPDHPNIDADKIEQLITANTKAIVPVHYAGHACDMDKISGLAKKYNLFVVEDAAQAIDVYYKGKPLGSFGDLATFSFHETKNIVCGEGGMLVINNDKFLKRSEIIREKGTNRSAFFRGEVNKYGWVDIGSSFLSSDILAAYLYGQLENIERIQNRRIEIWNKYHTALKNADLKGIIKLYDTPPETTNNAHMYFFTCRNIDERSSLLSYLKDKGIGATFHYLSLHSSEYYIDKHDGRDLVNADRYTDTLVRLPLYYELNDKDADSIAASVVEWCNKRTK